MKKITLKKLVLLLLAISTLVACGPKPPDYLEVDDQLLPYFNRFKLEAESRGISLDTNRLRMAFDDDMSKTNMNGNCKISQRTYNDGLNKKTISVREISINTKMFFASDEYFRFEVTFHEMGHCLLGLQHEDQFSTLRTSSNLKLMPSSWMNTYMYGGYLTETEKKEMIGYYVSQLFTPEISKANIVDLQSYVNSTLAAQVH